MRLVSLVMVVGLGVSGTASANPGPHGDDSFHTAPEPARKSSDHFGLGVGLLSAGLASFTAGAAMQGAWAIFTCDDVGVPDGCIRERRNIAVGSAGIGLMAVGIAAVIPGAILVHQARKERRSGLAHLRPTIGFGTVGLVGRF